MTTRAQAVKELREERPRSLFLRAFCLGALALVLFAWFGGRIDGGDLLSDQRLGNLRRFLTVDAVPPGVRSGEIGWLEWAAGRVAGRNRDALLATVALATFASVLSAGLGLALAPWTARTISGTASPFLPRGDRGQRPRVGILRPALGALVRTLCVIMRAVPEYVLAFLMGALFPNPAWACVIALVIHNGGILARLFGETLENLDQQPAKAWYDGGASRLTAAAGAQLPEALPKGLTYFFIRFETAVRESTVLGAIGFVSLGYWIVQERAAGHYDEMLLLIAMGAAVVVLADVVSWAARRWIRRAP